MNSPFPLNQLPVPPEHLSDERSGDPCKDYQRNCFRTRSGNGTRRVRGGQHLRTILMDLGVETSRWPIRNPKIKRATVAGKNRVYLRKRAKKGAVSTEDKGRGGRKTRLVILNKSKENWKKIDPKIIKAVDE